ncbi:hypothetical protein [Ensifer sp. SL37]|uniref:hypothetical protein n=1 Tax=Ensifer sp. SL37 TaxID=2995137 RepID=UPI002273ED01|nr:hypothetical protein [Ensifer sp. SL37]MCY1740690.1 hypothetical protein [Ensifer sp. SL37]
MHNAHETKRFADDPANLVYRSPVLEPMRSFIWQHENAEGRDILVRILFWVASRRSAKRRTILLDNLAKLSLVIGSEPAEMKDEFIALIESVI